MSIGTMSNDPLKPIRLIKEGDGALITFEPNATSGATSIAHAGTRHCYTCVGLYIPVSVNSCYIAHINATIFLTGEDGVAVPRPERECSATEGERVRAQVLKRFTRLSKKHGWSPQDAYVQAHKADIIMVCPSMKSTVDGVERKKTGCYVVQALQEVMGVRATAGTLEQGFLIEHWTGQTVDMPWNDTRPLSGWGFYNPKEQERYFDGDEWSILVEVDGWET